MTKPLSLKRTPQLGQVSTLEVVSMTEHAYFLDAAKLGEAFLTKRFVDKPLQVGDRIEVFLHKDPQGRLVASTEKPKYQAGDVAFLRVKQIVAAGAFMDWGAKKDLFVPMVEQRIPMQEGRSYVVVLYQDNQGRLAASSKLSMHLPEHVEPKSYHYSQEVDCLVASRSDLGFTVVVNGQVLALIHHTLVLKPLRTGMRFKGYVLKIRDDGKMNIGIQKPGQAGRNDLADQILEHLKANGGRSHLTDYSNPEEIFEQYKVSKALYKKTLSQLYKARKIKISKTQVELI